jgi:uncharacterized heparinase superfamily protein
MARVPNLRMGRVPDAPALPVRDPWPGDAARGARILKGELEWNGVVRRLAPGAWADASGHEAMRVIAHGFTWLRDLRALGTDAARSRARALTDDWMSTSGLERLVERPDVAGARITAWLGHYDFFAASADDSFRSRLMGRLLVEARTLAAGLPGDELDARALTALKGLIAAAVALPDHASLLTRALRYLPQQLGRQVLPDGCHAERSPAAQLAALQDLIEIRALLQAAQVQPPAALASAIERMAPALRALRHGDGGLALFNGAKEDNPVLIELALSQVGRGSRAPAALTEGGFHRLQAGRSVLLIDCGAPPPAGIDRLAHAGTLSLELSVGRERLIVNCGGMQVAEGPWRDAARATAAHSTLIIADTNSSELKPRGLGRHPEVVDVQRQEANGAHRLEATHDGYKRLNGAVHRRCLYMAESGEDVRGEDGVEAPQKLPYTVRFHLHPLVAPTLQQDGETVVLRLSGGTTWRFRAVGATVSLEESLYLGGPQPQPSQQIVLTGSAEGPQLVKWAITKFG